MQRQSPVTFNTKYSKAVHPAPNQKSELSADEITEAKAGNLDYNFYNHNYGISGAEYNGLRGPIGKKNYDPFKVWWRSQEDRMDFQELQDFELLSPEQQKEVIQHTINQLQAEIVRFYIDDGSCLLVNIIVPSSDPNERDLITVSLGDSLSLLVTCDKDEASIEHLNKLHHPDEPEEAARLKSVPGLVVDKGRIRKTSEDSLAVSGALGDIGYEDCGLTHIANITRTRIREADADKILITACDGLTLADETLGKIVKDSLKQAENLSDQLAVAALEANSSDNVSVMTMRLNHRLEPITRTIALGVYDGHGGESCAELLQHKFLKLVAENTKVLLQKLGNSTVTEQDNTCAESGRKEMHKLTLAYVSELKSAFSNTESEEMFASFFARAEEVNQEIQAEYENMRWKPTLFSSANDSQNADAQTSASRRELRGLFNDLQAALSFMKTQYKFNGIEEVRCMQEGFLMICEKYEQLYQHAYTVAVTPEQAAEHKPGF